MEKRRNQTEERAAEHRRDEARGDEREPRVRCEIENQPTHDARHTERERTEKQEPGAAIEMSEPGANDETAYSPRRARPEHELRGLPFAGREN